MVQVVFPIGTNCFIKVKRTVLTYPEKGCHYLLRFSKLVVIKYSINRIRLSISVVLFCKG